MPYTWDVRVATLLPPQADFDPPQLGDVLNVAEREGWEIFAVFPNPNNPRAHVVLRRPYTKGDVVHD